MKDGFGYQSEKFSAARRCLMIPFPKGESESISSAFHECYLGLKDLNRDDLDESAKEWVATLEQFMDTTGVTDPTGVRGVWAVKADGLTETQQYELSSVIDELADWFLCFSNRS